MARPTVGTAGLGAFLGACSTVVGVQDATECASLLASYDAVGACTVTIVLDGGHPHADATFPAADGSFAPFDAATDAVAFVGPSCPAASTAPSPTAGSARRTAKARAVTLRSARRVTSATARARRTTRAGRFFGGDGPGLYAGLAYAGATAAGQAQCASELDGGEGAAFCNGS